MNQTAERQVLNGYENVGNPVPPTAKTDQQKYNEVALLAGQLWRALRCAKSDAETNGFSYAPQSNVVRSMKAFEKWNNS